MHSWFSTSEDSQPLIENTVFDPQLVESVETKPRDMKVQLLMYCKIIRVLVDLAVQTHVVQGSTVISGDEVILG